MKNELKYDGKNIEEIQELTGCHVEFGGDKSAVIYTNNEVLICNVNSSVIVLNGKVSLETRL